MCTKEAKQYDRAMALLERGTLGKLRHVLLSEVNGRILEIGAGTGVNLPIYTQASHVTAVDVDAKKLAGTAVRRETAVVPFTICQANAQQLPFANHQFDNVVGTLVFCSIPQPEKALAEIRRVLKPNGRLFLLEHVRGQNPIMQRVTDWLHPAWFALQKECHLNRETAVTVQNNGFVIEQTTVHGWGILQMIRARPAA